MPSAIVVGGGVMGLASARALRQRGWQVVLLDRNQPGRGASWASAGIIGATLRDESDPGYDLRRVSRALWPHVRAARMLEGDGQSRREFVKRAAYVAPAILTLAAAPAYAKAGSDKGDANWPTDSADAQHPDHPDHPDHP